ncbi:MAG: hypothetical protein LBK60_07050 [Verrucomicrobiales bacterium]|jgi:membrane-bound serine protease (ClpP class)|nr:hypothetical protein [Verrucomicrobiales bacterium]
MTLILSLILAGLALVIAEIFLPGMICGIIGGVCLVAAVIATGAEYGVDRALALFFAELAAGVVLFAVWMKFFPNSPLGKKFSLPPAEGQTSAPEELQKLTGSAGVTVTPLRPSGTAAISGRRLTVSSEGFPLPAGVKIKVVKVEGARIVVRSV